MYLVVVVNFFNSSQKSDGTSGRGNNWNDIISWYVYVIYTLQLSMFAKNDVIIANLWMGQGHSK